MIKVFTGPMFSGKSKRLIETYLDNNSDESNSICFKSSKDTREFSRLYSRNYKDIEIKAIVIKDFNEIRKYINENIKNIYIDEVQFVTGDYLELLRLTFDYDINIYMSGLSLTSELTPFNSMGNILCIADDIEILKARCSKCKKSANYTHCLINKLDNELIGNMYEPLCKECYSKIR